MSVLLIANLLGNTRKIDIIVFYYYFQLHFFPRLYNIACADTCKPTWNLPTIFSFSENDLPKKYTVLGFHF